MTEDFSIFLLSDLHAFDSASFSESQPHPSYIDISKGATISQNPLSSLKHLIQKESLSSSILICAGDLGNCAIPAAIDYVWKELHDLQIKLSATSLLATVGNHDLDSRYAYNNHDPKGFLQTLRPRFPHKDQIKCDKYWSRHFYEEVYDNCRIIGLNTCAFHGYREEIKRGRISPYTIDELKSFLSEEEEKAINILLCHHHPQKYSAFNLGTEDDMEAGDRLLELFDYHTYGNWLVLHGHKHYPKLSYAAGSAGFTPIVFSAGSASACLYSELASAVKNQCYHLSFSLDHIRQFGLVGLFKAWDWAPGTGWRAATDASGLPSQGGFGFRGDFVALAQEIANYVKGVVTWEDIVRMVPKAAYIIPDDMRGLVSLLKKQHRIKISPPDSIYPFQLQSP